MAVGVFLRSDKVLLKSRDPLFSQVRQTFCQRLLPASQAHTAYLLRTGPSTTSSEWQYGGRQAEPVQVTETLGPQWKPLTARRGEEGNARDSRAGLSGCGDLESSRSGSAPGGLLCHPSGPSGSVRLNSAGAPYWLCEPR